MMTYKDAAIKKLVSIGISEFSAKEIMDDIIENMDYAPQLFDDFAEDSDDNWNNPVKYKNLAYEGEEE